MSRNTRDDVVRAAGRLFAERGYHGTSMRDLGRELGLFGSSIYSHVAGKQDLLVEVVATGGSLFQASAERALAVEGSTNDRLEAFVAGHIDVVLDHVDEARTFLNEARALDDEHRAKILAARDTYEQTLRSLLEAGVADGSFRSDIDPKLAGIFVLSILNSVDRWYDEGGPIERSQLVARIVSFVGEALA
jgi:AcrR family transcriptional regulator